jgi:CHAD domain-containing protein
MHISAELYGSLHKRVRVFSHKSKHLYDGDADALHRIRIASRRLRELLPVLRLGAHTTRQLNRKLRKVTKRLGAVRDHDVLIGLIEVLQRDRRYSRNALQAVQAVVEDQRRSASERLETKLPPATLQKIARRLKRLAKHLKADDTSGHQVNRSHVAKALVWALEARTTRRATNVREAIGAAGTVYAPAPLHHVRIALKKLRFALELKTEIQKQPASRDMASLKRAQDLLGRLHDRQVLIEHAREIQASRFGSDPAAWRDLGGLMRVLERDCRKLHARFVKISSSLIAIADSAGVMKDRSEWTSRHQVPREQRLA